MIIWLTSYPKSGNTWVRSFISTILFSVNGENDFSNLGQIRQFPDRIFFKEYVKDFGDVYEVARNWINVQNYLNLDRKIKIFKTHHVNCTIENNPFTNLNNTAGVIHIVRDPRNVVTSIMNHWSLKDINASKELIINENNWLGLKNHENDVRSNQIPTLISSWKTHYNSWKQNSQNYLLIKYEDLILNPIIYFNEITKFVSKVTKLNFNTEKVKKAIETNSFQNMKIITNINPFDKLKVYKLAGLEKQLEYFFSDVQLDNLFKDTYIGQIRKARKQMVIDRRRQVKNIEKKQLEEKRLRLLKKDWELSKRKMSKKARDAKRLRYIKEFSSFDPIEKLKLILHDQIKFPLISIPDEALFKANLLIRYRVNKFFTPKELAVLKSMFKCKRKKDRGVNWISILRAF